MSLVNGTTAISLSSIIREIPQNYKNYFRLSERQYSWAPGEKLSFSPTPLLPRAPHAAGTNFN